MANRILNCATKADSMTVSLTAGVTWLSVWGGAVERFPLGSSSTE